MLMTRTVLRPALSVIVACAGLVGTGAQVVDASERPAAPQCVEWEPSMSPASVHWSKGGDVSAVTGTGSIALLSDPATWCPVNFEFVVQRSDTSEVVSDLASNVALASSFNGAGSSFDVPLEGPASDCPLRYTITAVGHSLPNPVTIADDTFSVDECAPVVEATQPPSATTTTNPATPASATDPPNAPGDASVSQLPATR